MFRGQGGRGVPTGPADLRRAGVRSLSSLVVLGLAVSALSACSRLVARSTGPPTYYVSPSGNDEAAGTSASAAWRSLGRASSALLRPGTRLLLEGGRRFSGPLELSPGDGSNPRSPVQIGSYGHGRATIVGSGSPGISIYNTSGFNISNVVVTGTRRPPTQSGINLYTSQPGNRKLDHIRIDNVDVSGFTNGIAIGGGNGASGFRDVEVINSVLHNNRDTGLLSYGPVFNATAPTYAHANIDISHVVAYHNYGDPHNIWHNSGSGLVLGSVQRASISWSVSYGNGGSGADQHEGPQGIWTFDSTRVVIEHNLSYGNHTANLVDGGGFDLDQNVSHSYLQYNMSYGNDGAGYILYTGQDNDTDTGNVVRFNIASGDARKWSYYGEITILGRISDAAIYHNTVVAAPRPNNQPAVAMKIGRLLHGITVRNNIFVTEQPGPILASRLALKRSDLLLQGNDYFSSAGQWVVTWGGGSYYLTLDSWRAATGQEIVGGKPTGFSLDPGLVGPATHLSATRAAPRDGAGFHLLPTSPLVGSGLNLARLFRMKPGPVNYSGHPLAGTTINVGAQ